MSDGKILEAALKKDALREHLCRKAREHLGCRRIDREGYNNEIAIINQRYAMTEQEQAAFDLHMRKNFKRA